MAEGVLSFLGVSKQTSFGTITSAYEFLPITDSAITTTKEVLRTNALTGNFNEVAAVEGRNTSEGTFNIVAHPEKIGVLLRAVFGQVTTTTAAVGPTFYHHEFIPKSSNFQSGVAMTPYTVQVFKNTNGSFTYSDAQLRSMTISLATNDFVRAGINLISRTASIMNTVSGNAPTTQPWVFHQTSASLGGAANIEFENIELSIDNQVAGVQTLDGTKNDRFYHRDGQIQVRLSGTMNFINNSAWVDFNNFTQKRLFFALKDDSVSSGNEIVFDCPSFRFDSYDPSVAGPGRISASFAGTAEYNTASSYSIRVTLVNSRATY